MRKERLKPPALVGDLVSYRIRLLQIAARKRFEAVSREFGPHPRYLGLLSLIASNQGAAQSHLAEEFYLDRSSLGAILDALEREGLVERRATSRDRRVRRIFLTNAGRAVLDRRAPLGAAHEAELLGDMSPKDRDRLAAMLDRLDAILRAAAPVRRARETAAAE
jgi:MarR family transcriptional regulator, lower aerobic nicotinate degradation pathway regulator